METSQMVAMKSSSIACVWNKCHNGTMERVPVAATRLNSSLRNRGIGTALVYSLDVPSRPAHRRQRMFIR